MATTTATETIESVNPFTGRRRKTFQPLEGPRVDEALERAREGFEGWRRTSLEERARRFEHVASILDDEKKNLARVMSVEMGKPITSAIAEVEKCAWVCRHYAEHAAEYLAAEKIDTGRRASRVRYDPLGPVLAIMPWNFPFWQVFRFAAPALMAGNVGLLKHAPNVPRCALAIDDVFKRAGFSEGIFQNLFLTVDQVPGIIADERVAAVTLTGSPGAGAAVAEQAGRALKKVVLELGGSDPFIVMPSADLRAAADTAVKARMLNTGQSCIAAKRILLHEEVAQPFTRRFLEGVEALEIGDPLEEETEIGPLAKAAILEDVERQVHETVEAGATLLTGGDRMAASGFFFPPTVLSDVPTDSPCAREEVFGPVAALFRVADIHEAVALANDTPYGLGASVWTRDDEERNRFIEDLAAGQVFINGMVSSDPRLPFGGVKRSGFGRELGPHGIREFVNVKTVCVERPGAEEEDVE